MPEKTKTDDNRRAELATLAKTAKGRRQVEALANGDDRDAMLARSVLRDMGGERGAASMPSGSTEKSPMKRGGMPTKKPEMMRGGTANKKDHMYAAGGSVSDNLKSVPADKKGLKKLPKEVRNKMGYMARGGKATKKNDK